MLIWSVMMGELYNRVYEFRSILNQDAELLVSQLYICYGLQREDFCFAFVDGFVVVRRNTAARRLRKILIGDGAFSWQ